VNTLVTNERQTIRWRAEKEREMFFTLSVLAVALCLFVGMMAFLELGRGVGLRRLRKDPEGVREGFGAAEGAIFALLGLLIAFTFSGAVARFNDRRHLIVGEANAIETAYLRLDLVSPELQPAIRGNFRRYVDTRLNAYRKIPDMTAMAAGLAEADRLQGDIWGQAVAATRAPGSHPSLATLLLPALNAMIDVTTKRTMAMRIHPPLIIFAMLFTLALAGAFLAGYGSAKARNRSWFHMVGFAAAMAAAIYIILEIEYPRFGLINVDAFDDALVELRESIK
jgi:hypothetical protein